MSAGWMAADPVIAMVVMLQGAMPTAQNLVVLLHLDPKVTPSFFQTTPSFRACTQAFDGQVSSV